MLALGLRAVNAVQAADEAESKFEFEREWKVEKTDLTLEAGHELAFAEGADGKMAVADPVEIWNATFGTQFEFPSKDVHFLTGGPDGRIYFFCGEGGASISRKEGGVLHVPEEGAVMRSESDGSHAVIYCRGLHEPRGLGFDKAGNLFAADTGMAAGDKGRWLCLVDGGDYGWRMGWKRSGLPAARVPWRAENLSAPRLDGQPAWFLPAVSNLPPGSGAFAHAPGMAFSGRYEDNFFGGNATQRVIDAWAARVNGGAFVFSDPLEVMRNVDARAVAFGPDGNLYFAVPGEGGSEKPQPLFCLSPAGIIPDPQIDEVKQLLAGGMKQKASFELRGLLKHPDQRIRLAAEWALAAAPDGAFLLQDAALSPNGGQEPSIGRIHGIWGLGLVARRAEDKTPGAGVKILEPLVPLLEDEDTEVRAQTVGVLGELGVGAAFDELIKCLRNPDEKVSRFAAEALGRLGRKEVLPQLLIMIREEGSHDPFLRRAYVDALLGLNDFEAIEQVAGAASPEERMVALLAMRKLGRPEIARFLQDEEPLLVREAATAILDENIAGALPQLAGLIDKPTNDEALICRVLDANFRLGEAANAAALEKFAGRDDAGEALRIDALKLLGMWAQPTAFDYVTGAAQATTPRDAAPAREALEAVAAHLVDIKNGAIVAAFKAAQGMLGSK